ncbi:hypothetical protein BJX99DRAFT_254631 [Aspergillus californicus]
MSSLRETNPDLFGTVLIGAIPSLTRANTKNATRLVTDLPRILTNTGYKTYDVTTGFRYDENTWKALREDIKKKFACYVPRVDEIEVGSVRDQEYTGPRLLDLSMGKWESLTKVAVFKGIPVVLHRNGYAERDDYAIFTRMTAHDRGGLEGALRRLEG